MPTYRSKRLADARIFDGTEESAIELSKWFKAHSFGHTGAVLEKSIEISPLGQPDNTTLIPVAVLVLSSDHRHSIHLNAGDSLMMSREGVFEGVPASIMEKDWEQV